jgi:hypothetical protein
MLINGVEFSVGADPEAFMGMKEGTEIKFVSAHNAVPGTKEKPFLVDKGAVQVDGMALEFNIDPAYSFEEFKGNLDTVQNTLKGMIGDHVFLEDASVFFNEDFTKDIPDLNLMLGCSSDYNGWTMGENPSPDATEMMRTAGGHIHIGGFPTDSPFATEHFSLCAKLARTLDETLGVYSILWDKDDKRRSMYGQAGSFRPKSYGMEYRTLSNKWIFNEKLVRFVYDSIEEALNKMFEKNYEPQSYIRDIINNSNRESPFFENNTRVKEMGV